MVGIDRLNTQQLLYLLLSASFAVVAQTDIALHFCIRFASRRAVPARVGRIVIGPTSASMPMTGRVFRSRNSVLRFV